MGTYKTPILLKHKIVFYWKDKDILGKEQRFIGKYKQVRKKKKYR